MIELLLEGLSRLGQVLAIGTVLVSFSLLAYLFVYNFRDPVARAFVSLLGFATFVYVGDVFLATARLPANHPAGRFWLHFEWIGIALVVPAIMHLGNALLLATGDRSSRRHLALAAAYAVGAAVAALQIGSDAIVDGVVGTAGSLYLAPGPWFPAAAALFFLGTLEATRWLWRARQRSLTSRSRRRTTLLLVSVVAPLGVFPYLSAGGDPLAGRPIVFQVLAATANAATAAMLIVVAYAVAYHGALTPDRTVRRELVKYLVQAPLLGMFVIATLQFLPARLQGSLGLPRDVVFALIVVVGLVVYQLLVRAARPLIDRLLYGLQGDEVMWLRRLDERLLTAEDLAQLLDNILASLCDRLRVRDGLVLVLGDGEPRLAAVAGDRTRALTVIEQLQGQPLEELWRQSDGRLAVDGYWALTLRSRSLSEPLGILAVASPGRELEPDEVAVLQSLATAAQVALEDRRRQQRAVGALRDLAPEIADIQRLRGALEQSREGSPGPEPSLVHDPEFHHWVKDALQHYWGGPKLIDSPLLRLRVVGDALERNDYNAARAMRAVLDTALEQMKPEGQRSMTASGWLVYNILELRFVRGLRVRDIASRLAMSESDLYRKQRLAIEALAAQLAAMEADPTRTDAEQSPPGQAAD